MEIQKKVKYEEELDSGFVDEIKEMSWYEEIDACIQCGTCSSSCPMAVYMDYTPRQIIAMIKSGFKDEALRSFTIWFPSERIIRKGKMIIKEVGKEH